MSKPYLPNTTQTPLNHPRVQKPLPSDYIQQDSEIPLDVKKDLSKYNKFYISKEINFLRLFHCCEFWNSKDFRIFVENEDNDLLNLYTAQHHFECCNFCDNCIIGINCCYYACCNSIAYQLDYKRNNRPFYTHGINITKGCHICKCHPLCFSCVTKLFLKETQNMNSPDINNGTYKGSTEDDACPCVCKRATEYYSPQHTKEMVMNYDCCSLCMKRVICLGICCDDNFVIAKTNGKRIARVTVTGRCCSSKVQSAWCGCLLPQNYYEVIFENDVSSEEKFHAICMLIHFEVANGLIMNY